MLDAFYWLAAGMAAAGWATVGVRRRNFTALPLLASFAFCMGARAFDLPFNRPLWIAVDVAVAVAVAWPLFPLIRARAWVWLLAFRAELMILALFLVGFAAYAMAPPAAYIVSSAVATVQLLVTVPWRRFAARWKRTLARHDDWTHFDLRVTA